MPVSDDIVNLFQQFGGQAGGYQELARAQANQQARERWPLVRALGGLETAAIPPVARSASGTAARTLP
jgi:hypothetical protein